MPPRRSKVKIISPADSSRLHVIKSWPVFYAQLLAGLKLFEVRLNDRDYRPRDYLLLREFDPEALTFTGRSTWWRIGYLTGSHPGIKRGYVVMSVLPVEESCVPARLRDQVIPRKK